MRTLLLRLVDALNLYGLFSRYTRNTATIFMLHRFSDDPENHPGYLSPDLLSTYLGYLRDNNYNVISLSEYIRILREGGTTHKTVVFTVDDGFRDFYDHAFKIFDRYEYPATIFLTGDFIEGRLFFWWNIIEYAIMRTSKSKLDMEVPAFPPLPLKTEAEKTNAIVAVTDYCKKLVNSEKLKLIDEMSRKLAVDIPDSSPGEYAPLSWDQIREMSQKRIDYFPHTMTHPILTRVSKDEKRREIRGSKELLESRLGVNCDIFCYPNGGIDDFDEETISILREEGFVAAVTGMPGFDTTNEKSDMFRLKRFGIPENFVWFKQYVSGLERFKDSVLR